ncbi:MAG TPA: toll/interleukin-1 receptor domain-containing protein, partial [Candidatus Binatia bacterium]|nr:toll/interleukin-1 receptor domain-containing protein [Candidatus Binatia bacterium]
MPLVPKSLFASREKVGIFISYRRADTAGHAGRLVDQLKSRFGDQLFFDVDSIKPGANFHQVIEETFTKCGAVIVLIGKRWLERDTGTPRFGEEQDVITQEIGLAMASKLPILPVLVDGASMPAQSQLPPSLASLSSLNAIDLRHTSFDRDLQAVNDHLVEILGGAQETVIEKFALKLYGPFLGNSIAKIQGGIVLFAAMGALWALGELAGAAFLSWRSGFQTLMEPSIIDAETTRLQAVWTAAFGALIFAFFGRRSIRWWRHATILVWISLAEI